MSLHLEPREVLVTVLASQQHIGTRLLVLLTVSLQIRVDTELTRHNKARTLGLVLVQ
jgi:hypothetical protein